MVVGRWLCVCVGAVAAFGFSAVADGWGGIGNGKGTVTSLNTGVGVKPTCWSVRSPLPEPCFLRDVHLLRGGGVGGEEGDDSGEPRNLEAETSGKGADPSASASFSAQEAEEEVKSPGLLEFLRRFPPKPRIELPEHSVGASVEAVSDRWRPALVLVDAFAPFHGGYLSSTAKEQYDTAVIHVSSSYVAGYLYQEQGNDEDALKNRIPQEDEVSDWMDEVRSHGLDVVAVVCESDAGLDEAERLGRAIEKDQNDRGALQHNGWNPARRNKFLMNEEAARRGLPGTVLQKLCSSVEEAFHFAKTELGMEDIGSDIIGHDVRDGSTQLSSGANVPRDHAAVNRGLLGLATNAPSSFSQPEKTSQKYCVVKPVRGVASDDVHLCASLSEVRHAFLKIHGTPVYGTTKAEVHSSVLVQEFASGTEYAVDIVSRGGQHKVAALWRYDKRPANGAPFVYFATELVDAGEGDGGHNDNNQSDVGRLVCRYAMHALDVLGVQWGMTHTEVIVSGDNQTPRLVEVNCRQHNTNFAPITTVCLGYNALDLLLAAFLGGREDPNRVLLKDKDDEKLTWDEVPEMPASSVRAAYGAIVHLVSFVGSSAAGSCRCRLVRVNEEALQEIEAMESVMAMEVYDNFLTPGATVYPTVDIRSDAGWVHLAHPNPAIFQSDYNRIVELMPHLFEVEEIVTSS